MFNLLIVFDSQDGQTEKIAQVMANTIRLLGCNGEVTSLNRLPKILPASNFDAMIVGGPIHAGCHSKQLKEFVVNNLPHLNAMPSAFFSVSLSAAGDEGQREDAWKCLNRFLTDTGFRPIQTEILAGAIKYRRYGFFKRLLMKWIVRRAGGPTDTSKDYEYTSWSTVSRFVERFLESADIDAFPANDAKEIESLLPSDFAR